MKKKIIIATYICLFFMFLVYQGVFRDNTDPLKVTRYYYECIKNWEWPVTYQLYKRENFDIAKMAQENNDPPSIDKVELKLLKIRDGRASVLAKIIHKDKKITNELVELEKNNRAWLITGVKLK